MGKGTKFSHASIHVAGFLFGKIRGEPGEVAKDEKGYAINGCTLSYARDWL